MKKSKKKKSDEKDKIIKEKDKIIENNLNQMKKMQADFINFKNRIEKEKEEFVKYANRELMLKLLDVLDNLERASQTEDEGIKLIYKQFKDILEKEGLEEIDTTGKFDPYYHEVIAVENSDCEEGKIIEVLQKGYLLNNKVLRHSKVKICKR
ncbi:MAG: nucleotide exchange factor GrpE [Methanomicrobia archaeon]|nr:nucleotide exchange factor GrpE [Methanomicrobia archaeon]RLF95852.1 MAG: nucleotide exchange factor GrpE [Thermococci archaeon]RLG01741.1 MAG: nucleotide exchange factor GrpE [Thermococci archaeon]HDN81274.1 nucleotide exchange factor GrpE [Methanomicrobia archaeon]